MVDILNVLSSNPPGIILARYLAIIGGCAHEVTITANSPLIFFRKVEDTKSINGWQAKMIYSEYDRYQSIY